MLLPLPEAIEHIEKARVIVESHIRDSNEGAYRTNAIQISERLTEALHRIEALENLDRELTMIAIPAGGIMEYLPDRYDRLRNCAEVLASGTDFGAGFLTADIVRAFADHLTYERVLDGLSEHDSDTIGLLVLLDLLKGPQRMAWRLTDWLSDDRSVDRNDDDEFAVLSVLARTFSLWCAALVGADFEDAQGIGRHSEARQ
ncbi:hypothetical protein C3477_26905 [Mycobacterium kansasii]|uniref:hypothetical protein n=1 Tax=Mycobacterium kansasii TaxID=1768 RepID=UPI000CDD3D68|nr:hypothetical protein [Mycobacterium kansasii]POX82186.1 hypothetical protein C3B43_25785 [Mycobacterium kansasii]POX94495.1 hypothetical protein C3477_26905 [Mycobacterium kansasii]POY20180.1 hypothetical protein C3476_15875 [Mycobacterium kansasii]